MRCFLIHYDGLYLGGNAVVFAESQEQAMQLLRADDKTRRLHGIPVIQNASVIEADPTKSGVAYHDDGDY
jgi:hypothetical protein